jgi:hypothetical protein
MLQYVEELPPPQKRAFLSVIFFLLLFLSAFWIGCAVTPDLIRSYTEFHKVVDLMHLLHHNEAWVREQSVLGLGELQAIEATTDLTAILVDPNEKIFIKAACAHALGQIGNPGAIPALIHALDLESGNSNYRYEIIWALSQFEDDRVKYALESFVYDSYLLIQLVVRTYLGIPFEQ